LLSTPWAKWWWDVVVAVTRWWWEVVVAATRWWEQCGNHIQARGWELARRLASLLS